LKKLLLILAIVMLFAGQQRLFACSAAYYQTTIQCACGGTADIYECQNVNFDSSCTTCTACGFVCCGNFYCNSCNTGSCTVKPSASVLQNGILLAASSGRGCVATASFKSSSKRVLTDKTSKRSRSKVQTGIENKSSTM